MGKTTQSAQWLQFFFHYRFFFVFFQGHTLGIWKFPGQGSNQSYSASLHHRHSNAGSEPPLQTTSQLWQCQILNPLRRARESNPHPHGYQLGLFLLSHNGNSLTTDFLMIANEHKLIQKLNFKTICTSVTHQEQWIQNKNS